MVRVVNAPGFEDFEAKTVPGFEYMTLPDGRLVTVVADENNEIFVIPSEHVESDCE